MTRIFRIREYGELSIGDRGDCSIPGAEAGRLLTLAERAARRLKLSRTAILARTSQGLQAGQVVGVLATPRTTLDILPKIDGDERTLGVAPSDVYQMLAYARAYGAVRLVLLYPWDREMGEAEGVVRPWTVAAADGRTDFNCHLDVATIDVGRPGRDRVAGILRAIVDSSDADQDLSRAA